MKRPVVCPRCNFISITESNTQSETCQKCGTQSKSLSDHLNQVNSTTRKLKSQQKSEDMQWALILIGCGLFFLVWGILSPETSIKKRWHSGPGTPVGWVGGFFFTIGAMWLVVQAFFSNRE